MSYWHCIHEDETSASDLRDPDRLKEPIPAATGLVCRHPLKRTFSRPEKPFSRADDIYIHTFRLEIRFSEYMAFDHQPTNDNQATSRFIQPFCSDHFS
jgi:hypothetical protein